MTYHVGRITFDDSPENPGYVRASADVVAEHDGQARQTIWYEVEREHADER